MTRSPFLEHGLARDSIGGGGIGGIVVVRIFTGALAAINDGGNLYDRKREAKCATLVGGQATFEVRLELRSKVFEPGLVGCHARGAFLSRPPSARQPYILEANSRAWRAH